MPDRPSGPRTYVRTLVSGNTPTQGNAGPCGSRTRNWNGTNPTQALPSNSSTVTPAGSRRCTSRASYRQCRKLSPAQSCSITGNRTALGQRPAVATTRGAEIATAMVCPPF